MMAVDAFINGRFLLSVLVLVLVSISRISLRMIADNTDVFVCRVGTFKFLNMVHNFDCDRKLSDCVLSYWYLIA